jgi:hypothetical protein
MWKINYEYFILFVYLPFAMASFVSSSTLSLKSQSCHFLPFNSQC